MVCTRSMTILSWCLVGVLLVTGVTACAENTSETTTTRDETILVPEQILFDDEIYHSHRILSAGLDTGASSLALDLIQSIGPGGHFLAEKHTRTHLRQRWIPELTHPGPSFDGKPVPEIRDRAKQKLEQILSEHQPPPLDKNIQIELNNILAAAECEIGM